MADATEAVAGSGTGGLPLPEAPKLVANITYFARALRQAGVPVGPARVADALRAVEVAGVASRSTFYWTLRACFTTSPEHRVVFDQLFRLFWRDPRYLEHMMAAMLPAVRGVQEARTAKPGERRAAEALLGGTAVAEQPDLPDEGREIELDASATLSGQERLRSLDFEQMSAAEIAEAKQILSRFVVPVEPLRGRRHQRSPQGARVDWRRAMRSACGNGGELRRLPRSAPGQKWPDLVVICDISGSMSQYSRMVLHLVHALANRAPQKGGWRRVHGFTFGTRLTNITRHLKLRDVDVALAAAGAQAQDWQGGTRIGDCLGAFNRQWSRRVLGAGAVVVLVSDGLDCGAPEDLRREMQRLQLSCRGLIWVNPLLRWQDFAPRAGGIRAMLPYVDSLRAGHSINSLSALAAAISRPDLPGEKARLLQLL